MESLLQSKHRLTLKHQLLHQPLREQSQFQTIHLLLEQKPKDFDVATNAKPEEIRKIFPNCRLIGRRFRIAHILFRYEIVEVTTFRGMPDKTKNHPTHQIRSNEQGMLITDNQYGTIEEDAPTGSLRD